MLVLPRGVKKTDKSYVGGGEMRGLADQQAEMWERETNMINEEGNFKNIPTSF